MLMAMLHRRIPQLVTPSARCRHLSSTSRAEASYGFIGLGQMGYRMAKNLRARINPADTLVVYDVNTAATKEFMEEMGSATASTSVASEVAQVASSSETIITSLPEPRHVQSVMDAVLSGSSPPCANRLFIDCSTIDPITSRAIAKRVTEASAGIFLDAPMSGGIVGAEAGTLTFMLGAPESHVDRATKVLRMMGKRVVHLGDQGAGLCGKLANNYLLAVNNIATAEAMSMGIRWGLEPKALAGMINTSTGKCWPSEVNNPVPGVIEKAPASRDYTGGFGISLMSKDLRLAMTAAQEYGVKLGLGQTAQTLYETAEKDPRCKGKDFSSIYRFLDGPE